MPVDIPMTTLAEGTAMPLIGFGTSSLKGRAGCEAITSALHAGYRLVDTAAQYGNEAAVGEAIRISGIDPEQVLVTTKIAGGDQGRGTTEQGLRESLRRLGLERVFLTLIHWPNPSRGLALETWRELVELRDAGLTEHIGVSNFRPEQLQELIDATGVTPEVNQIQLSPALPRHSSVAFHREKGIVTEAWGPLGGREQLSDQFAVQKVAAKHGVSTAQVCLRWAVDQGIVAIPKASSPERQAANLDLGAIHLDDDDRRLLEAVDLGEERAWDSREHEEW